MPNSNAWMRPHDQSRVSGLDQSDLEDPLPRNDRPQSPSLSKRMVDSIFPLLSLVFVGAFLQHASSQGFGRSYAYPLIMITVAAGTGIACLVSVWTTGRAWRRRGQKEKPAYSAPTSAMSSTSSFQESSITDHGARKAILVFVNLVLLVVLVGVFGTLVAVPLFMISTMLCLGYRNPYIVVAMAVSVSASIWLIFQELLLIDLPGGIWSLNFYA